MANLMFALNMLFLSLNGLILLAIRNERKAINLALQEALKRSFKLLMTGSRRR